MEAFQVSNAGLIMLHSAISPNFTNTCMDDEAEVVFIGNQIHTYYEDMMLFHWCCSSAVEMTSVGSHHRACQIITSDES